MQAALFTDFILDYLGNSHQYAMSYVNGRVAIVERLGRIKKSQREWYHMRLPFGIDKIAAVFNYVCFKSEIVVETKTKDNVFVMMNVATQYRVNRQILRMLTINIASRGSN